MAFTAYSVHYVYIKDQFGIRPLCLMHCGKKPEREPRERERECARGATRGHSGYYLNERRIIYDVTPDERSTQ